MKQAPPLTEHAKANLLQLQQLELDGYHIYLRLAGMVRDENSRVILQRIAGEEKNHYEIWRRHTHQELTPHRLRVGVYYWIARLLGLTFGLKLMELGEERAQASYTNIGHDFPETLEMLQQEEHHETKLLAMLDEEALRYAGSVVLGLNDALVELTGALAGLTFAFQNTRLIALAGLITGISASFSMAASEYLSQKSEGGELSPVKSAIYTGIAYIFTVIFLVLPYLIFRNYLVCLSCTILNAILVIAVFNFYISVAKGFPFRRRFTEMTAISLGVAAISFVVGTLIRTFIGVDL